MHVVFRGPNGGTVRVIRSQLGRADTIAADKTARLAGVTAAQFWAGPPQPGHQAPPAGAAATPRRRTGSTRDRITSLVLALHAAADRPLGFDQVVELSGNRVTRAQVRTARVAARTDAITAGQDGETLMRGNPGNLRRAAAAKSAAAKTRAEQGLREMVRRGEAAHGENLELRRRLGHRAPGPGRVEG